MKLRMSITSPFVRKCLIVAIEAGLDAQIERVPTSPWAPDTDLPKDNPLNKIPTLITDGGEVLYDSPVICEYLDSLHGGRKLIPVSGGERWRHLRLAALGDGIMDAAVQIRIETAIRPEDRRWPQWIERQTGAITRGLAGLEAECGDWGDDFLIGQITVATALGYLDFRPIIAWRTAAPALAAWFTKVSARASISTTVPVE